jgi:hypothetical protein
MTTQTTEPALPPFAERLNNARQAAKRVISTVIKGDQILLAAEEAGVRLEICGRCEFYRHSDGMCSKCGCLITVKVKLATERCPLHKWESKVPQLKTEGPILLTGSSMLDAELDLREVLPPKSELVQVLNQFHQAEQRDGCKGCLRRRYARSVQAALVDFLNGATDLQKQAVRAVFPNTTHVSAGSKAVAWSVFGVSG